MTCVNKGLWAQDCQLRIANDGGVSATIQEQGTPIEVASLDNEFTRLGLKRVDFIKMDIEGAEIMALEGCRRVLGQHDVWLAIGSYHEFEGDVTYPRVETLLAEVGYQTITEYPVNTLFGSIHMDGGGGKGFRRGHDASWKKPSKEYADRSPSLMPNR